MQRALRTPFQTVEVEVSGCCATCSCAPRSNSSPGFLLSQGVGTSHAPLPPRSPGSSGAQEGLCKRRDISDGRRVQQCEDKPCQSHCSWVVCRITSKGFYTNQRCSSLFFISSGERKVPFFFDFRIFYKTAVLIYCLLSLSSPVSRRGSPF